MNRNNFFYRISLFIRTSSFLLALAILSLAGRALMAQELTILTAKGTVTIKRGSAVQAASTGVKFRDKDVLSAKAPCYVVISSAEGKTVEIRTTTSVSASELNAKLKSVSGTMSGKVVSYIFGELKNSVPSVKDYQQGMAATAMAERTTKAANKDTGNELFGIASGETSRTGESTSKTSADEGIAKTATKTALNAFGLGGLFGGAVTDSASASAGASARAPRVNLLFPHDTYLIDSTVQLYWSCERPGQTFIVRVVSPFGAVMFEQTTQDSTVRLNARALATDQSQCYRWSVQVQGFSPEVNPKEYCLSQMYDDREKDVRDSVATLQREIGRSTPLAYAAAGVIYERNRCPLPAFFAYREALRLSPETEEYKIALLRLIERWGVDYRFAYERLAGRK